MLALFDEYELSRTLSVLGVADRERQIPPPYPAVHDVIEVEEMVRESLLPITPFIHVPFPDANDIRENAHSVTVAFVVMFDPPAILISDEVTVTTDVDEDVTVMDVRVRDPAEI